MTEQDEIIINPGRAANEPEIPATGILCINPGDAARLGKMTLENGGHRHFLFNSALQVIAPDNGDEGLFVAGPAIGAPMAVMTLEKLIALGCRRVLVWGCCGSLVQSLQVGDIFLSTGGFSEEGTSRHYPSISQAGAEGEWPRLLRKFLVSGGWQYQQGPVWSTDAPYRETRAKVQKYAALGALAVEMEFTALAAVAAFREIEMAAVYIVSDELWGETWRPGFNSVEFKRRNRNVLDYLYNRLRNITDTGE